MPGANDPRPIPRQVDSGFQARGSYWCGENRHTQSRATHCERARATSVLGAATPSPIGDRYPGCEESASRSGASPCHPLASASPLARGRQRGRGAYPSRHNANTARADSPLFTMSPEDRTNPMVVWRCRGGRADRRSRATQLHQNYGSLDFEALTSCFPKTIAV